MIESFKDIIMHDMKREMLLEMLKEGKRFDERGFEDYRKVEVKTGVLDSAEGSALVKIGKTQVLSAIKFGIMTPFPDRPEEGVFMTNAEFLPLASPLFEPGPPDEDAIELARVVDRGIRSAETIDLKSLYLEEGKVLGIFADIYILDHSGNMEDASSLATLAALSTAYIPKYEDGKLIMEEKSRDLELKNYPLSTTIVKVGEHLLVDPVKDEALAADTKITITTTENHVCSIQKGKGSLKKEELLEAVDIAFKKGSELRKYIKK